MSSPLEYFDPFNQRHIEPSVSGLIRLQETEPVRPDPINDLLMLGTPRSGRPGVINDFLKVASLADYHDPDRTADRFVAIARTAKTAVAEVDMFGAARIRTVRVGAPTQSETTISEDATELITIRTADYGSHTRRARRFVEAGTVVAGSKKITLRDDSDRRVFVGDNLGLLLNIQYTGNGSAGTLTIRRESARIAYSGNPVDTNHITVNGVAFEFESEDGVTGGRVEVEIGGSAGATFDSLTEAINANCPGCTAVHDAANSRVIVTNLQDGVVATVGTAPAITITAIGAPASLTTTLTSATDGSENLAIPLTSAQFKTIGQLAAFINNQLGYTCTVNQYAEKSLPSTGLDVVSAVNIKAAVVALTGYVAAIADWVNTRTQGNYVATVLATGEPDEDDAVVYFTGGNTPLTTVAHWEDALNLLSAGVEKGGIILADTDNPVIWAMIAQFVVEQRVNGKWFRAYFGASPGTTPEQALTLAGSLDHQNIRLASQRVGVLGQTGAITYLDPIFLAAALAGMAAGNRPYEAPSTNKRLRFVGIHENDDFDQVTRESLIDGGVTVVKSELGSVKVALAVTTSRDPDKRMARIVSEIDTLLEIDATIRDRFLKYRGKWADSRIVPEAMGDLISVLAEYARRGAVVNGVDPFGVPRSAYQLGNPAVQVNAGALEAFYDLFIGGEVNHVAIIGGADYQRLVGVEAEGGANISVAL